MILFKLRHSLRGHSIVEFQHQFSLAGVAEIWVTSRTGTYWQDGEESWSRVRDRRRYRFVPQGDEGGLRGRPGATRYRKQQ